MSNQNRHQEQKEENIINFTNSIENEILFDKATRCLQEAKNEEAVILFEKLLEKEPDNIHALNGKGSGLMQAGHIDEAEEIFNLSLKIKDNEMANFNLAIIYRYKKDYDTALKYIDKTIELYPHLRDTAYGFRNEIINDMNKNNINQEDFSRDAQELIDKANILRDKNEIWQSDELHEELSPNNKEFKKITLWDAWQLYEEAIEKDSRCEKTVTSLINELKNSLLQEFLFFDITKNNDFNPEREIDKLKLMIMKHIYIEKNITAATSATNQILTTIDENDIDALNFKGALYFYFDELDKAIECFEKVAINGDGVYKFFADFNKAFVLRRKTMVTHDAQYMVEAMDIYDEMLKNPAIYDKVKPYQREILDKLQEIMDIPLF
ncbi:MAG: tetratricopeptide repeat protein [Methanosphaera stadtmanae]|nr:tetratricopeptide repeat protein [Methanosphaera stadtmanae]